MKTLMGKTGGDAQSEQQDVNKRKGRSEQAVPVKGDNLSEKNNDEERDCRQRADGREQIACRGGGEEKKLICEVGKRWGGPLKAFTDSSRGP